MEFDVDIRREIERICVRHDVRSLALFGSAVDGSFDETQSDLDFAVEFAPMSRSGHKAAYFGLLFDLEDMFGRSVDLVEPKSVENPFVRESIAASRKVVYDAA